MKYLHTQYRTRIHENRDNSFSISLAQTLDENVVTFEAQYIEVSFIAFLPTILQKQCRSVLDAKGQQLARDYPELSRSFFFFSFVTREISQHNFSVRHRGEKINECASLPIFKLDIFLHASFEILRRYTACFPPPRHASMNGSD